MIKKYWQKILTFTVVIALCTSSLVPAQTATTESIDTETNARIRQEGMSNSQIMRTLHYFTDVFGARLTGSPNHEKAANRAVNQMQAWGMQNAHLEPSTREPACSCTHGSGKVWLLR